MVKNLPTMWETQVQSLGWEDPLEKGMSSVVSSILARRIPRKERSLAGYSPWGRKQLDMPERPTLSPFHIKVLRPICQPIWEAQQWPQGWKGQFSFQSQRRAAPKGVHTAAQLCSSHMPAGRAQNPSETAFSDTWTKNVHMYKSGFEEAEKPEIKLPTFVGWWRKQGSSRKTSTSLTMLKPLPMWITTNWKILKEVGIPDHLAYLLKNLYAGQEATVRTRRGTTVWF